jgi:predicted ATPase
MREQVRIDMFGGLSVRFADRVITRFRTRRTAAVLSYLAVHIGQSIPRAELAETLWPDSDSPRQNLRMALTSLRKQFGDIFCTDAHTVSISEQVATCDVKELLDALDRAETSEDLAMYWEVVEGHRGRVLPGHFDVWVLELQEDIDRRVSQVAMRLAAAEASRGSRKSAIRACAKALEIDRSNKAAASMLAELRSRLVTQNGTSSRERPLTGLGLVAVVVTDGDIEDDAPGRLSALDTPAANRNSFVFCRASDAARAVAASGRAGLDCVEVEADGVVELRLPEALCAVAAPGQCLASERAVAFLQNRREFSVTDLGLYRLPGMKRAYRVFQLSAPGSTEQFPPINAHPALTGPIPASFTRFIGRELEIADIVRHFGPQCGRLLTLVGPGGNGKTRLALEAIKTLLDGFHGRVWFVPLAEVSGSSAVASSALEALGIKASGKSATDEIAHLVGNLPSLLVFDNAEHVLEGAASLIQKLLVVSPKVSCLVTSRTRLGLPGESIYPVMPLPLPAPSLSGPSASVLLFVDRAQAVIPDFALTPANAEAISEICLRLEGIPLAIELAAARVRMYPPGVMLEQLDERLSFLRTNARGLPERQQTMRLAIDWSYRLLDERLQTRFPRLSVFRNGWAARAAAEICGATEDDLANLVDSSLITVSDRGTPRFHMLETLREYADSQLSESERESLAARHNAYYTEYVAAAAIKFRTSDESGALVAIDQERENILAALQQVSASQPDKTVAMAVELERYWEVRGHYREAFEVFQKLLNIDVPSKLRAEAETAGSLFAIHLGKLHEAQAMLEQAISTFEDLGDERGLCSALRRLGNVRYWIGDYAAASTHYARAEGHASDAREISILQHNLGNVRKELGDLENARRYFNASIALSEQIGDARNALSSRFGLAAVDEVSGDVDSAEDGYQRCLAEFERLGDRFNAAQCWHFLGNLAAGRGDADLARDRFERSRAINLEIGDAASLASNLFRLSALHLGSGENKAAIDTAREGCTLLLRQGFRPELTSALAKLAVAYQASGQAQSARFAFDAYTFVRKRTDSVPDEDEEAELKCVLGAEPGESAFQANSTPDEIARTLNLVL